jgi:oligopeptide/dipeptide ABC transporter ATP-binding protein
MATSALRSQGRRQLASEPILQLNDVSKGYRVGQRSIGRSRPLLNALIDINLTVGAGQILGIVGESGCGKSTLARIIVGLASPDTGSVVYEGVDLAQARRRPMAAALGVQMVFQDPYSALNPRMPIGETILEPLVVHGIVPHGDAPRERDRLLDSVGLSPSLASRYPHELSGGQRQRVNIARALAVRPKLIVADEAVSSLDVSVQGQILNLLSDLRDQIGLAVVFISHDLNVVAHLCDRVAIMYLGRIIEEGDPAILREGAMHHYTRGLASAIPQPIPGRRRSQPAISGELPSPTNPPSGCHFRTRCPAAEARCAEARPLLEPAGPGHRVACYFPGSPAAVRREAVAGHTIVDEFTVSKSP